MQIPDYSLAREGNLYGLWDNDTQELAFSCKYEYLRAIHDHYIIFQQNGRRGLMYYDGRILFKNKYDELCRLKYFHHGTTFWTLVKNLALELGHKMIWEYDWVMENFINLQFDGSFEYGRIGGYQ